MQVLLIWVGAIYTPAKKARYWERGTLTLTLYPAVSAPACCSRVRCHRHQSRNLRRK